MRQHILATIVSALMFLVSPSALAEVKIAFVEVQLAILSSEGAKRVQSQIAEEFKDNEAEIREAGSDRTALMERFQKNSEVMSDAEKNKLAGQIREKETDINYLTEKLKGKVQVRQNELFAGTEVKLRKAIEELVLSEDYDIILPRSGALYVGDLYDITRKVTEKLNEMDKPAN